MMNKKVLILSQNNDTLIAFFEQKGYQVEVNITMSAEEFTEKIGEYNGIVFASRLYLDKPLIDKATPLSWVARIGSGIEHIDENYLLKKNIPLITTPEGNARSVAEYCLTSMLNSLKHIQKSSIEVARGIWKREENRSFELLSQTVGIIGYGNTGSAFGELLSNLGVNVLVYDKYKSNFSNHHLIQEVSQQELMFRASVISIHLPLNAETMNYCDTIFFSKLNKTPIFINTSRGKIAKLSDVLNAINNGYISHANLDVLENENLESYNQKEKFIFDQLINKPNVTFTPHIAGYSYESKKKMIDMLMYKLESLPKNMF